MKFGTDLSQCLAYRLHRMSLFQFWCGKFRKCLNAVRDFNFSVHMTYVESALFKCNANSMATAALKTHCIASIMCSAATLTKRLHGHTLAAVGAHGPARVAIVRERVVRERVGFLVLIVDESLV